MSYSTQPRETLWETLSKHASTMFEHGKKLAGQAAKRVTEATTPTPKTPTMMTTSVGVARTPAPLAVSPRPASMAVLPRPASMAVSPRPASIAGGNKKGKKGKGKTAKRGKKGTKAKAKKGTRAKKGTKRK